MIKITPKKKPEKTPKSYNISVIGFSGPVEEKEKRKDHSDSIIDGIGKSSFCARFIKPHQDEYTTIDKRSIISPIDFGSKLINNHNTLWWGNTEDENGLKYSILEHTVFLDDSRLEPFEVRQAKADKYEARCAGDYFKNWTQKQFLGFSNQQDNESTPMIPDKFKIDAFLILIDISKERLEKQPIQDQLDFVQRILKNIKLKTHPVVLGLTKFDKLYDVSSNQMFKSSRFNVKEADPSLDVSNVSNSEFIAQESSEDETVAEVRKFFKKHEIVKKLPKNMKEISIVETSADRNINVAETFKYVAYLIDRFKNKNYAKNPEIKPYKEALKIVERAEKNAYDQYTKLLKEEIIRYNVEWKVEREKLKEMDAYNKFLAMFGTDEAKKVFKDRVKNLKNLYKGTIKSDYRKYIELALNSTITESSQVKSNWDDQMEQVTNSPKFDDWFIILEGYDENGYNYEKKKYWDEDEHVCSLTDKRIPFHFLTTKLNDSDMAGLNFRNELLKKISNHHSTNHNSEPLSQLSEQLGDESQTGSMSHCGRESLDTSLNESFDYLSATDYSEHSPISGHRKRIQRSSSTQAITSSINHQLQAIPRDKNDRIGLKAEKIDARGRWSWSGGENLKIILLGSEGLTKELAEEIEQDNRSHDGSNDGDHDRSSVLEVIKVEEAYSDSLKAGLQENTSFCVLI